MKKKYMIILLVVFSIGCGSKEEDVVVNLPELHLSDGLTYAIDTRFYDLAAEQVDFASVEIFTEEQTNALKIAFKAIEFTPTISLTMVSETSPIVYDDPICLYHIVSESVLYCAHYTTADVFDLLPEHELRLQEKINTYKSYSYRVDEKKAQCSSVIEESAERLMISGHSFVSASSCNVTYSHEYYSVIDEVSVIIRNMVKEYI